MKKYINLIGLFLLIYIMLSLDTRQLKEVILNTRLSPFFIAIFLNVPHIFIKSLRWNILLRMQNIHYSLFKSFSIYMSGLFISFITPGRLGEFIKVLYLKSEKNINISLGLTTVIVDRLFDLALLIFLAILGTWQLGIINNLFIEILLSIIIIIIFFKILFDNRIVKKIFKLLYNFSFIDKNKKNINKGFQDFYAGIYLLNNLKLIYALVLTCFSYLILVIQAYLLTIAMQVEISFINVCFFMALSSSVTFIPISISGLGTRDAMLIYLFSIINISKENAVVFSLLIFITFYINGGFLGAIFFNTNPINMRKYI